jgi:hypothetical protein
LQAATRLSAIRVAKLRFSAEHSMAYQPIQVKVRLLQGPGRKRRGEGEGRE